MSRTFPHISRLYTPDDGSVICNMCGYDTI